MGVNSNFSSEKLAFVPNQPEKLISSKISGQSSHEPTGD